MRQFAFAALLLLPAGAAAVPPLPTPEVIVGDAAMQVSERELRRNVEKLVSFGTRHTLSSQTHPTRGIGAALNWSEAEFRRYSQACGGCLQVGRASETVTGRRIPRSTRVTNVFAVQRGTERPNDVVIITAHIDSRVSDVMDAVKDAPGANDDGSGSAAVLEAARVLSSRKFPGTVVYALLSGEEQGLHGGKIMADYAKKQGWNVIANLNNDIIGNSCGSDGLCNDKQVRVFSEGPRWQGHEHLADDIRSLGGENDAPSRNLLRFLDTLAERLPQIGLDVMQIWRTDRFGRGGDHIEFLDAGYPAVRLSVAVENYNQQHQDLRVENGVEYGDTVDKMDFPYVAKVTKLNVAALAWLASAPPPPEASVEGAVQTFTRVKWNESDGAQSYVVRWRRTDAPTWTEQLAVPRYRTSTKAGASGCGMLRGDGTPPPPEQRKDFGCYVELKGVRVDDWVFGVASVSANGFESPVASAVPGGAFRPYVAPAESK
jgi:hypothetical protein